MNRVGRGSNQRVGRRDLGNNNKTEVSGVSLGQKKLKVSLVDNKKNKGKLARLKKFFGLKPKEFDSLRERSVQVVQDAPTEGKVKGEALFGPKTTRELAAYNKGVEQVNETREAIHQRFQDSDQAVGRQDAEEYQRVLEMFSSQFDLQGYNDQVKSKMQETIEALRAQMLDDQTFLANNQREIDSLRNSLYEREGLLEGCVQKVGSAIAADRDAALDDWLEEFSKGVVEIVAEATRKRNEKREKVSKKIKKNKEDMKDLKTALSKYAEERIDKKNEIEALDKKIERLEKVSETFGDAAEMIAEDRVEDDAKIKSDVDEAEKLLESIGYRFKGRLDAQNLTRKELIELRKQLKKAIDEAKDTRTRLRKRKVKLKLLVLDNWIDGQAFQSRVQRQIDKLEKDMGKDLDVLRERRKKQFKTLQPVMPDLKVKGVTPDKLEKMKKTKVKQKKQEWAASTTNTPKPVPTRRTSLTRVEPESQNSVKSRPDVVPSPPPAFADKSQFSLPDVVPPPPAEFAEDDEFSMPDIVPPPPIDVDESELPPPIPARRRSLTSNVAPDPENRARKPLPSIPNENNMPDLVLSHVPANDQPVSSEVEEVSQAVFDYFGKAQSLINDVFHTDKYDEAGRQTFYGQLMEQCIGTLTDHSFYGSADDHQKAAEAIIAINGNDLNAIKSILNQIAIKHQPKKGPQGSAGGPAHVDGIELD